MLAFWSLWKAATAFTTRRWRWLPLWQADLFSGNKLCAHVQECVHAKSLPALGCASEIMGKRPIRHGRAVLGFYKQCLSGPRVSTLQYAIIALLQKDPGVRVRSCWRDDSTGDLVPKSGTNASPSPVPRRPSAHGEDSELKDEDKL